MTRRIMTCLLATSLAPCFAAAERPSASKPPTATERQQSWSRHRALDEASPFRGLSWRNVGPVVQGGRLVDIEVSPDEPYTFYVAFASGGLWRTRNNGVDFEPLFDEQPTLIMGDVAIDPNDAQTIWVGTGENNSSRSSYGGHGVFRSTDGGETWEPRGLIEADRIGRILVDPRDSSRVYVAALGPLYTRGGQRGVYRTEDGGESWTRILAGDETTGFVDLVMDPTDPDVLYAAAWDRMRRPWGLREGGPGSAIYRTTDGGESWSRLAGGFPRGGHVGRIGLSVCRSEPKTLYALLDNQELLPEELWDLGSGAVTAKRLRTMSKEELLAQDPEEIEAFLRRSDIHPELTVNVLLERLRDGSVTVEDLLDHVGDANASLFETDIRGPEVYRSDDGGTSWQRTHPEPLREVVYTYGYYFGQIRCAPEDPARIYVLGVPLLRSTDGGKSFENVNQPGIHGDHQAMWIDPVHPQRVILGNDGGLAMTFDGGESWIELNPIPVGQFYTVAVDLADPYRIYGGLQDNGVRRGSSLSRPNVPPYWSVIGGGDGAYVQIDPRDNATLYTGYQFGHYTRYDPDGSRTQVRPQARLGEPALRHNWQTPIQLSSHNADIVYFGANRLYRSLDRGESWSPISGDLSRSPERGNVPYGTITTLDESSLEFGLIWAGTDDGQLWMTPDGGRTWRDVATGLPRDRWVSRVVASRRDPDVAYVTLNGYRDDDITPYVFRTADRGESWSPIVDGLPAEPVNVLREDPVSDGILYIGTDRGVFVSLDEGERWSALGGDLPSVPVHDLAVHPTERELVAGTHGRSVFVLDVLPVQELDDDVRASELHLFPFDDIDAERGWRERRSRWWFREEDAPEFVLSYWSKRAAPGLFVIKDADGRRLLERDVELVEGIGTLRWDLLLDEELALAAEAERLAARDDDEDPATAADRPWSEAIRLGRPLHVTPGDYELLLERGPASATRWLEVRAPEPLEPRLTPKPKIRGRR